MTGITAVGYEYTFSEGTSDKYWQVFCIGSVVATRYGRRGAIGQVTVHHEPQTWQANDLLNRLLDAKERKGYRLTSRSSLRFEVPAVIAEAAQSTNTTGSGGQNTGAAHALAAYYLKAALDSGTNLQCNDPLLEALATGTLSPRRIALGAFAGYTIKDAVLRNTGDEDLAVMAGLNSLGGGPSISDI